MSDYKPSRNGRYSVEDEIKFYDLFGVYFNEDADLRLEAISDRLDTLTLRLKNENSILERLSAKNNSRGPKRGRSYRKREGRKQEDRFREKARFTRREINECLRALYLFGYVVLHSENSDQYIVRDVNSLRRG